MVGMMRRAAYLLVFACAFLATAAATMPLDLLAARHVFGRLSTATGAAWRSGDIRIDPFAMPPAIVARDLEVAIPGVPRAVRLAGVRVAPGWGLFAGRRAFTLTVEPGAGELRIAVDGDRVRIDGRDLELARLDALDLVTSWRYAGVLSVRGAWQGLGMKTAEGEITWEARDLRVDGAGLAGVRFPPTALGRSAGKLVLAGGTVRIAEGKAEGGEVTAALTGAITLANPWRESVLGVTTVLTPTAAWEQKLGETARLLSFMKQPDGSLRLTSTGTIARTRLEFR